LYQNFQITGHIHNALVQPGNSYKQWTQQQEVRTNWQEKDWN